MKKLQYLLVVVGIIQVVLGAVYLMAPHSFSAWMGYSPFPDQLAYPLGMLSSRFLIYGLLLIFSARHPEKHRLLILGMVTIQLLDLSVGGYYTLIGTVSLSLSAFPMFNAAWIALLLWRWRPAAAQAA